MKHPGLTNKVNEKLNEAFEWSKINYSKVQNIIKIRPVNPATVPTQKGESVKSNASQP